MSRKNRLPVASSTQLTPPVGAGPAHDDRTIEEVRASVRRKMVFGLLALSAPLIALGLSLAAERTRRTAFESHLPRGVTLATRLAEPTASAATVGDRLAEIGAELRDNQLFDGAGKPVVFHPAEAPPPPDADEVSVVEIQGGGAG